MKEKVIALGFFDGVHLGHAALLRRTAAEAARRGCTPAVFTFDRVPKEVITGIPCPLINSPEDRRDLIYRLYGIREILMGLDATSSPRWRCPALPSVPPISGGCWKWARWSGRTSSWGIPIP